LIREFLKERKAGITEKGKCLVDGKNFTEFEKVLVLITREGGGGVFG